MPACEGDGCYAITVEIARFKMVATAVHDPLCDQKPNNYAHVEVRELYADESVTSTPPKSRKKRKSRKVLRAEWRTNIVNRLERLVEPGQRFDG